MDKLKLPEDCARQWEILLLLIASEEKKIDRTNDNEIDTMTYFLKNEGVKHILLEWLRQMQSTYGRKLSDKDTALKCDSIAHYWRQQGNERFRKNLVDESYKCYCKSVVYAKHKGLMYSLALANRSAALIKLKRYKECLSDIDLALASGYPSEMHHKLILRRADCYVELNQKEKAVEAMEEAVKQVKELKITAVKNENMAGNLLVDKAYVADFDRHVKILQRKMGIGIKPDTLDDSVELPPLLNGDNPHFVYASSVLQLRRSETLGRMVVTLEETKRGDILFSEEPYAWVPLPCDLAVCDGCCDTNINVIPCTTCSRTVYCGVECRERALVHHQYECIGSQADLFPTIGIAHLALRVLLKSAINGFPTLPPKVPDPSTASDLFKGYSSVDDIEIYNSEMPPFYRMFNLVTNFDKMNNMDYIQYALTAVMLTLYLEHFSTFFEYLQRKVPYRVGASQLRVFAAALMHRALGQLVCNGHAALTLATVDDGDETTVSEREVRRATAIYPSAAMMNHSCDPNIINTFYKCRLIVRGSRDLSAGVQVLNCYGPHRARDTTSRRRHQLRAQYLFTCSCTACLDIERRDFVLQFTAYACPTCKGPVVRGLRRAHCPQCHAPFNVNKLATALDQADELQAQGERATSIQEQIDKRMSALRLRQQVLYRHHEALRPQVDTLARLYAGQGDFSKSLELIKQNIQSLEYQYGSFSVEVAHELRKLSDVMLERIVRSPQSPDYRDWCLEAHKIIKKAVQLMDLNFGSWEPLVKRLKEQESIIAALVKDTRTPDATDNVHQNLHYNLKI